MSGKNSRDPKADQRTNGEGKQVSNKVLLAAADKEYELMRADLTYIDLPHHLSLHEPTQKIEFVYFPFPEPGNGFPGCSDQGRSNRGSGCSG